MDRENVFKWIHNSDFDQVVNFLKTSAGEVASDDILKVAVGHFFKEVLVSANSGDKDSGHVFHQLFILHTQNYYKFSDGQFEDIIVFLAQNARKDEEAFFYASKLPQNSICTEIITSYNKSKPVEIDHGQTSKIQVREVSTIGENKSTSIFNSNQEKLFFFALRNCFPTYYIYPNIALSSVIKSGIVENVLETNENGYFYSATVDFIVVDQFNDFKPIFAVELDSEWHRLNNQADKDKIKNKILKAAGLPLYRIEHTLKYKSIEEFEQVIVETIRWQR